MNTFVKFIFVTVAFVGTVHAETMDCQYKGGWNMADGTKGDVSWNMRYVGGGASWTASGTGDDGYGPSTISGTCTDRQCTIKQVYTGGSANGSVYDFVGDYADQQSKGGKTETSFTGTWKGGDGTNGKWSAKGSCVYK